jgi:hypothetical protein
MIGAYKRCVKTTKLIVTKLYSEAIRPANRAIRGAI